MPALSSRRGVAPQGDGRARGLARGTPDAAKASHAPWRATIVLILGCSFDPRAFEAASDGAASAWDGGATGPDGPVVAFDGAVADIDVLAALQTIVDEEREGQGAIGAGLAVRLADGRFVAVASGAFERGGRALTPADRYQIGEVTEPMVAVALLQLVDEGKVSLDDRVDRWVGDVQDGDLIHVRHLLQHASGLADYYDDPSLDWYRDTSPSDLIDWATRQSLAFTPGATWEDSGTNYILAGMILERAEGRTIAPILRARVFAPLGMSETYFAGEEVVPTYAAGYFLDAGHYWYDPEHPSVAWASGAIVSTLADQTAFAKTWASGTLTTSTIAAGSGGARAGFGVLVRSSGLVDQDGMMDGTWAFTAWDPQRGVAVAAFLTTDPSDPRVLVERALAVIPPI